jgi:hypothetical protein
LKVEYSEKRRKSKCSIYKLSWDKSSFLAKFDLFTRSIDQSAELVCSEDTLKRSDGYSALSSTYYSIAGTVAAKFRSLFHLRWSLLLLPATVPLFLLTWLPLGGWCYFRMLPLSDKALACAGGYDNFSADKCDVRQSILQKRKKLGAAVNCIFVGLKKPNISHHTKAFLYLGLASAKLTSGDKLFAEESLKWSLGLVGVVQEYNKNQAIRIYKKAAELAGKLDSFIPAPVTLRRRAKELAENIDAKDQLLKMGVS